VEYWNAASGGAADGLIENPAREQDTRNLLLLTVLRIHRGVAGAPLPNKSLVVLDPQAPAAGGRVPWRGRDSPKSVHCSTPCWRPPGMK
jgi:hypothetical protein